MEAFYVKTEAEDYRNKVIAALETLGYKFDTEGMRVAASRAIYICANAYGLIGCGHKYFPQDYEERHLFCGQFVKLDYFEQPATEKTYEPLPFAIATFDVNAFTTRTEHTKQRLAEVLQQSLNVLSIEGKIWQELLDEAWELNEWLISEDKKCASNML